MGTRVVYCLLACILNQALAQPPVGEDRVGHDGLSDVLDSRLVQIWLKEDKERLKHPPATNRDGKTPPLTFLLVTDCSAGDSFLWVAVGVMSEAQAGDCFTLEGGGISEVVCAASFENAGILTVQMMLVGVTTFAYTGGSTITLIIPTPIPTPSPTVGMHDDPHVCALSGECYDIKKPSEYILLRAPSDEQEPAKLELIGDLDTDGVRPCGLYVKHFALSGSWLDNQVVRVRPHTRNVGGANRASKQEVTKFSLQLGNSSWMSFTFNDSHRQVAVVGQLTVRFVWREQYGQHIEAQSLEFSVSGGVQPVTFSISQAAHQALNIDMWGLSRLGYSRLGGVLGTDGHLTTIEEPSLECRLASSNPEHIEQRTQAGGLAPAERASTMRVSWE